MFEIVITFVSEEFTGNKQLCYQFKKEKKRYSFVLSKHFRLDCQTNPDSI